MFHDYDTRVKKLESTMNQKAIAQFEENMFRNIKKLRDEVLNLISLLKIYK